MLESFVNAVRNLWAVDELRKRVIFTLVMLAVYRAGIHVPVPGIDQEVLKTIWGDAGNLFGVLDLFSGGNLRRISIFALGIMPYITASIILQLMTSVYPALKKIQEEGELGRRKITQYTRYLTVVLCMVQGTGIAYWLQRQPGLVIGGGGWSFTLARDDDIDGRDDVDHVDRRADHRARDRQRDQPAHLRRYRRWRAECD